MRALILSDIHSNLEALAAVLDDAEGRGGFDEIWCLGDFVGYGPDPGPCLERVRRYGFLAVAGNHDYGAVDKASVEDFNDAAKAAIRWTAGQLSAAEANFLAGLPAVATAGPFTLVHGSLRDPLFEYLLDRESALATLSLLATPFCLVGHSHLPFICRENGGLPLFYEFTEDEEFPLGEERCIINPGCVGQPRDRDPRPSYAIYDSQTQTILRRRVTYEIRETQEKMRRARLPQYLVERLAQGV
jgi:diadenosine tetraphosphatase ApaH/serine/threonine PP2A family protein phosphatase